MFGALLVIVGVMFAAGLFAAQVLLTLALALLIVAGPPLIALSAIPELSHLASAWGRALLALALVPLAWTVLFATAGALTLDATSFTGGANGLPGQVAAAFAALITFVLAVRLPWTLLGSLKRLLVPSGAVAAAGTAASAPASGVARVAHAHARLRNAGVHGALSLGRSAGLAAGAVGAPAGGLVGLARRRLERTGTAGATTGDGGGSGARDKQPTRSMALRERVGRACAIVREAPGRAHAAATSAARRTADPGAEPTRGAQARPAGSAPRSVSGERSGSRPAPRRKEAGNTHTTAPAARVRVERPGPPGATPRQAESSSQNNPPQPGVGRRRAPGPPRAAHPAPARAKSQPAPGANTPAPTPHRDMSASAPRPSGRADKPSEGQGAVPPANRDPIRPPRPRKPDRRPRKGRGR